MTDDDRPPLIERARGGDWDAIEDLVVSALAPAFDAAVHLFGEPEAGRQTEDALFAMLVGVRRGEITSGDPMTIAAKALFDAAKAANASPFESGFTADDLVAIDRRPDDSRRSDIAKIPAADRVAAVLAFALDLDPGELSGPLGRPAPEIHAAIDRLLAAIPHERPEHAFRDILDARASLARVPIEIEERVLDRFEAAG